MCVCVRVQGSGGTIIHFNLEAEPLTSSSPGQNNEGDGNDGEEDGSTDARRLERLDKHTHTHERSPLTDEVRVIHPNLSKRTASVEPIDLVKLGHEGSVKDRVTYLLKVLVPVYVCMCVYVCVGVCMCV